MIVEGLNDIYETGQAILDTLNAIYLEHGDDVTALPVRQFVSTGGPGSQPHDCEQVTVSVGQIYTGTPGNPSEGPMKCFNTALAAVYHVEVVRQSIPTTQGSRRGMQSPTSLSPEDENSFAKIQLQDARLMLQAGLLVGDNYLGSVADVAPGPESGGYQAMTMTVITGVT